eukprot:363549-Chlamydomonas_euryale.AAC.3
MPSGKMLSAPTAPTRSWLGVATRQATHDTYLRGPHKLSCHAHAPQLARATQDAPTMHEEPLPCT